MSKRKAKSSEAVQATKKPKPTDVNSPNTDLQCKRMFYNTVVAGEYPKDSELPPTAHQEVHARHVALCADARSKDGTLVRMGLVFQSVDVVRLILTYADDTPVEWKYFGGAYLGRLLSVKLNVSPNVPLTEKPQRALSMHVNKEQNLFILWNAISCLSAGSNAGSGSAAAESVAEFQSLCERNETLSQEIRRSLASASRVSAVKTCMTHSMHYFLTSIDSGAKHAYRNVSGPYVSIAPYSLAVNAILVSRHSMVDFYRFRGVEPVHVPVPFEKTDSMDAVAAELQSHLANRFKEEKSDSIWYKLILIARMFPDPYSMAVGG
jgi:hypothetical protein